MDGREAPGTGVGTRDYDRLKPDAVGLFEVVFMTVATAALITAMTGNDPSPSVSATGRAPRRATSSPPSS